MFDIEMFISEVEKRPALYDVKMKEYSNREFKKTMWEEVAMVMYENWTELSTERRKNLVRELLKRWKSIRDQFRKELKAMKSTKNGQSAPKRKKRYVHFDSLLFLLPSLEIKQTSSDVIDEEDHSHEGIDIADSTAKQQMPTTEENTSVEVPRLRKIRKTENDSEISGIRQRKEVFLDSLQLRSENSQKDFLGNKAFLMSLLPLLDSMPEEKMLECRIKLMEDIRFYRFPKPSNPVQQSG